MREALSELLRQDRINIDDARWLMGNATARLVADHDLEGWWEGYQDVALAFSRSETVCGQSMMEMRSGLEFAFSEDPGGEELLAASKMILSGVVLLAHNPLGSLSFEKSSMHDDIDPLLRKGAILLGRVSDLEVGRSPLTAVVHFNRDLPGKVSEHQRRNRLRYLIDNAVRADG